MKRWSTAAIGLALVLGHRPAMAEVKTQQIEYKQDGTTLMGFVDSGAVDFDTAVNLTRGVGQTMARLADWEVSTLVSRVEEMEAGEEATGSRIGSALRRGHRNSADRSWPADTGSDTPRAPASRHPPAANGRQSAPAS